MQCNTENACENWTWQLDLKDELEVQSIERGPEDDGDDVSQPEVIVFKIRDVINDVTYLILMHNRVYQGCNVTR